MAGVDYTVNGLLSSIKRRGMIPASSFTFTDDQLTAFLNDELLSRLVPAIKSVREEFFVNVNDVALVSGQQAYDLPSRAIGVQLRDLSLVDSAGKESYLARIDPSFMKEAGVVQLPYNVMGYYWQGNKVMLYPIPSSTVYSLRQRYERRPSDLVATTQCAKIASINTGTKTVTTVDPAVDTTVGNPSTLWTTANVLDLVQGVPPFNAWADSQAVTTVASNSITFTNALPTGLAVGDWVSLAGQSPVAQIPYEGFMTLAELGLARVMEAMDDVSPSGAPMARQQAETMLQEFLKLISPRTAGTPQKVVDRHGIFQTNNNWWR
ncbi:MAG TPA: hypothetical protein PLN89_06780 [Elusimicrobiota bacterium]|nr:hypothetical protein [Elusimicrobiota bacterium]